MKPWSLSIISMWAAIGTPVFLNQRKKFLSIISMLAAIGTPVFLNQRQKGVDASRKSDLYRQWMRSLTLRG